jgi:hypothetical protein
MKKRILLVSLLLALGCFQVLAQEARALLAENPDRAACNLHSYEFHDVVDTPAPAGFTPVYISHYGRHGSRYDISSSTCENAFAFLHRADSSGELTLLGKALLEDVRILAEEHAGMGGELSPRGGREHEKLAERMADRFPTVFLSGKQVNAVSSTVQRCVVSMGYFMASLRGHYPELEMTMTTGDRYAPVIRLTGDEQSNADRPSSDRQVGDAGPGSGGNRQGAARQGEPRPGGPGQGGGRRGGRGPQPQAFSGDFSAFLSKVFVHPSAVEGKEDFIRSIYKAGCVCQDLDFLDIDLFREYFTAEELYSLWLQENASLYSRWGNSVENGYAYGQKAKPLLQDIVDKADAALAGNGVAADLRFGHDMGYMALCDLLGIDSDHGARYRNAEVGANWLSFQVVPAAANVQMVFYQNSAGEALVKILRNEQEMPIPGLKPVTGPYYRWEDFKARFAGGGHYSLEFDKDDYLMLRQRIQSPSGPVDVIYKAFLHIPYVSKPLETDYQSLCIFEPVFLNGKPVDASCAPILFSNHVGGYMPVDDSMTTDVGGRSGGEREAYAIASGMVVVVPGCRGRTVKDSAGYYIGKAPAVLVDLKAAVRYLRHNKGKVPGDTEKIISVGCSAGGAISAALGASGNSPLFEPYLKELGAADERDDFFAAGVFSPIMDIQHADMAYEWEFGETPYKGELVDQALSKELRKQFSNYEKSLKLKGINGFGTLTAENLRDYIATYWLNPSATLYLQGLSDSARADYLKDKDWIGWDGTATHFTMEAYNLNYVGRYKGIPAFDTFDLHEAENGLFGDAKTDARHMTEFSLRHTSGNPSATLDPELQKAIDLMNPFTYVKNKGCAKHWWIRHGTTESGISRAAMVNFSTALMNKGKDVDSKLYWEAMHCVDKDPEGFIEWIQIICR